MCNPALALMAVMAASTAMQIKQQNNAMEAQAKSANEAQKIDYGLINRQEHQTDVAATDEEWQRQRQGERELAKIRVAQGESGALGNSSLRELHNSIFNTSLDIGTMESNRENSIDQLETQKLKTGANASSRINEAKANTSNPLLSFMKIGSSGASGYAAGQGINKGTTG